MKKQKCNDCPTKLSLPKVISICFFVASSTFGLTKIYLTITDNTNKIDILTNNTKTIADYLKKTGQIPYNSCFNQPDNSKFEFADISKPLEQKKRIAFKKEQKEACNNKDFETNILK